MGTINTAGTTTNKRLKYFYILFKTIFNITIEVYKFIISPVLNVLSLNTIGGGCRFYPSCSIYSKQVVDTYGFCFKSFKLILFRLIRCQPIKISAKHKHCGYDPVE